MPKREGLYDFGWITCKLLLQRHNKYTEQLINRQDDRHKKFQLLTDVQTSKVSRQAGSAKSEYLPAGRQGGIVKGGGGGGGVQEEAEPEQEHS